MVSFPSPFTRAATYRQSKRDFHRVPEQLDYNSKRTTLFYTHHTYIRLGFFPCIWLYYRLSVCPISIKIHCNRPISVYAPKPTTTHITQSNIIYSQPKNNTKNWIESGTFSLVSSHLDFYLFEYTFTQIKPNQTKSIRTIYENCIFYGNFFFYMENGGFRRYKLHVMIEKFEFKFRNWHVEMVINHWLLNLNYYELKFAFFTLFFRLGFFDEEQFWKEKKIVKKKDNWKRRKKKSCLS